MAQIGMPFRIGVVAALVLAVAYFAVLKPSDDSSPPPQAPGVEGLTSAVDKAKNAAATAEAANARHEAAAGQAPATAATAPVAPAGKPATKADAETANAEAALKQLAKGDRSEKILRELAAGRTAVVLFSSPDAADDVHVRRALRKLSRHGGKVRVHHIALAEVAKYDAITRGVQITQAPTLLVIGGDLKARRIVGFTDRKEIDQLVNDVSGLRTPSKPTTYKEMVERACGTADWNIDGDVGSLANIYSRGGRVLAVQDDIRSVIARLRSATVPSRYASFHGAWLRELKAVDALLGRLERNRDFDAYKAALRRAGRMGKVVDDLAGGLGLDCRA